MLVVFQVQSVALISSEVGVKLKNPENSKFSKKNVVQIYWTHVRPVRPPAGAPGFSSCLSEGYRHGDQPWLIYLCGLGGLYWSYCVVGSIWITWSAGLARSCWPSWASWFTRTQGNFQLHVYYIPVYIVYFQFAYEPDWQTSVVLKYKKPRSKLWSKQRYMILHYTYCIQYFLLLCQTDLKRTTTVDVVCNSNLKCL